MKILLPFALCILLAACGSDNADFSGAWDGSFDHLSDNCPFGFRENVNEVFPMVVSEEADGTFVVLGADGSRAVGGQGKGEEISFEANAPAFGNFGSIAPYVCASSATVGFLTQGDDEAKITVSYFFTNCAAPAPAKPITGCSASYHYNGTKH